MIYEHQFLLALFFTVIIETICLFFIVRIIYKKDNKVVPNNLLFFLGVLCQLTTLPHLWFILPLCIRTTTQFIIIGEFWAVIVEASIYFFVLRIGVKRSLVLSLLCNIFSFLISFLFHILG